jgi:hypothetical protein
MKRPEVWLKEIEVLKAAKERQGAEDMREAAAQLLDREMNGRELAKKIRVLPLPGDPS